MHKLYACFCALGIIAGLNSFYAPDVAAKGCHDLEFIFARGSGEALNDQSLLAWKKEITTAMSGADLDYAFYELGSASQDGFQYPAVAVAGSFDGYANLLGAVVSGGESSKFGSSVLEGSRELQHYITKASASCPATKFVLGGYSQGAMVISRTLPQLDAEKIVYASTFGDPKLYLPEGKGLMPAACLGREHSNYRIHAPDCHAYEGVLGSLRPYQSDGYFNKLGTWCNEKDIMCSSGMSLKDHTSYVGADLYSHAAATISAKVKAAFPEQTVDVNISDIAATTHNLAIIIDSSGSMSKMIETYKAEAKKLAKKVFSSGGKVALYEYRDLKDPFLTVQHCDYTCDYETLVAKLDEIKTDGGGDDDESALSAILYAMNSLKWQVGATKSIMLLTDAKYLAPDRDGVTLAEVTKRSLEIDPVNIYVMTSSKYQSAYQELTTETNGAVIDIAKDLDFSTDKILSRPVAVLPNLYYEARVGETLYFDASESYALGDESTKLSYDWDLDGDGEFEIENGAPAIECSYDHPAEHFIQVRVHDARDSAPSTMSAKVKIVEELSASSTISELSSRPLSSHSAEINFATDAEQVLLIVDELPLGFINPKTTQKFTLEDISSPREVTLVPYRAEYRGESRTITVQPLLPLVPNTGQLQLETGVWGQFRHIMF